MEGFIKRVYHELFSNQNPVLNQIIHVLLIFLLAAIGWWILNYILRKLEQRYGNAPFFKENRRVLPLMKKAGHYMIIVLLGIGLINLTHLPAIEKVFYALMIMLLASFTNSLFKELLPYLEQKMVLKTKTVVDNVIIDLLKRFATVIIFVMAAILTLDMLGVNIMPFIAGAGVAGIAIGFAAKDTLSNLIAGILLIMDRPFEVGDRIEVWSAPANSATWGDVIDIGLRATKIRTTDNIVIIIPNNEIMKRDIINYTTMDKDIRVRIPIGIAYDADVKKAKEIIERVSLELDWVKEDPPPKVVVKSFGDSAVNMEARIWISRPRKRMDTISHITDRVKEVFQQEGIEIPYPKRDIYIKKFE
ncbi:MAG: mechanosensitive ion channel family protein [Pseudomonadota bacterium]